MSGQLMLKNLEYWNRDSPNYQVWTAGTMDGIGCDGKWGWCPNSIPFFDNISWGQPPNNNNRGTKNCAALNWDGTRTPFLNDKVCSEPLHFICEVTNTLYKTEQNLKKN